MCLGAEGGLGVYVAGTDGAVGVGVCACAVGRVFMEADTARVG